MNTAKIPLAAFVTDFSDTVHATFRELLKDGGEAFAYNNAAQLTHTLGQVMEIAACPHAYAACVQRINDLCDEHSDEKDTPCFSEYTAESSACANAVIRLFPSTHSVYDFCEVIDKAGRVVLSAIIEL